MPSIINATTSTGLVQTADNSGSLQLQTNNGTTAVTIDTSQNVGVGTTSPSSFGKFVVAGQSSLGVDQTDYVNILGGGGTARVETVGGNTNINLAFSTKGTGATYFWRGGYGGTASMLIDGSGDVFINTSGLDGRFRIYEGSYKWAQVINHGQSGNQFFIDFRYNTSGIGSIQGNNSNVSYNTSSDYRLKENVVPMTGALDKILQLKPVNWIWKVDGSEGQGFIAHELQEIIPDAVTGEKDAVQIVDIKDEQGNVIGQEEKPVYQGVDTSFLVATLTKAIQELKAELDATKAEVQALKGVA